MGKGRDNDVYDEDSVDYDEEEDKALASVGAKVNGEAPKKGYVGIHSSGFSDFLLKPEFLQAMVDLGFEHPSEDSTFVETQGLIFVVDSNGRDLIS